MICSSAYQDIFVVLRDVAGAGGGAPPPGSRGTLLRALDTLRAEHAPEAHIRLAERAALATHLLALAAQSRDEIQAGQMREQLAALADQWLDIPIAKQ